MNTWAVTLLTTGAFAHGLGYYIYHRQTRRNASKPNPASWFIWSFIAILNAFSFDRMGKSPIDALQFYVGSIACVATFVAAVAMGKVEKPKAQEWKILGIGLVAVAAWVFFKDARLGNYIGLVAYLVSFWPTLCGVFKDPNVETPGSWMIWTFSNGCTFLAMIIQGKWFSVLTPAVFLVSHALVAQLCSSERKQAFRDAARYYQAY